MISGAAGGERRSGFSYGPGVGTFAGRVGVAIVGTGSYLPEKVLSNDDLTKVMDTSDEWIVQRTGIRQRHVVDRQKHEQTRTIASRAMRNALDDAGLSAKDMDLLICSTMTPDMECPATASMIGAEIGLGSAGAMDLNAACSSFVYAMNIAHDLIRGGAYRTIGLVGADTLSNLMDYSTAGRGTAILFGDGAGAAVLRATDDLSKGLLAQAMHSNSLGWKEIFVPHTPADFPEGMACDPAKYGRVQMNGAAVFKFAVTTFGDLIAQTLDRAHVRPEDVDMFVCHQSNMRILHSARERFGIPEEKLYVNIDRVGNTVSASVPLCLDELRKSGRVREGQKVMFLAFGGGLTWASSLWQL